MLSSRVVSTVTDSMARVIAKCWPERSDRVSVSSVSTLCGLWSCWW